VAGPGDAEVERRHGRRGDGHSGRDGILEEGEGLRGLVAGAVAGSDGYVSRHPACMQWQIDVEFNSR
jgi:hypothetical protein